MKLTNHPNSNIYDINTYVMRGTITINQEEFEKISEFLIKIEKEAIKDCNTYVRDGLSGIKKRLKNRKGKRKFCLGITATRLIAGQYNLKNYKDVNYGIRII